ncbi:site-specific DNA-methyltransferase [Laribacter hongkongensis]|uniref:site-specific DNA-methyltransferase (adenine-specific) n=1 Tax=Laribacter hongkongensis TaxID=168471 RepID=A0A248LLU5_9NEIS|nr:site-specific DNA-methyltransferase [Laribacter hongkongensis]ASJ25708.1 methyltransferase [Laribacter hongkongensis]MCG9087512.1 site-specific DNA-methyltransferase [Laribacter hongkongensis]MCG9109910.1 site-specific DNA-methyltransferase [Laribacter hongkongensis]MCG9120455.1 site-specific DNA-methyltransferase [Laribacter hongkongensis]
MSEPWLSTHIERWPTEKLVPYARNARTHSEEQVAQIAASIVEFGFTNPILAGSDGVIVAGHGRLAAAQKLGLDTVPVVVLDHLTPTQRRALIIADNRIAENAGWDDAMLRIELQSLQEDGFNLDITGFDVDALAEIMAGEETTVDGNTDDDAVPEVLATPISRPGDVWEMGKHRLVCGDATDPKSYELLMADAKADMVFTDPPYNVDYANSAKDKMRGKDRPILNDNLGDGFYDFLLAALTPMLERCAGATYIAMSSSELDTLQQAFRAAGGKWSTFIIWAKNTFTLGRADYQRQYEPILYGWPEGQNRHWCGDRDQGDVWNIKKPQKNDLHPTMKPVELVERAIRNSTRPGDIVLDPFGGSGTTLIAAEKSGRIGWLIELDPKYVDVIVRRWQDWSGQEAYRELDAVKFNDLAALAGVAVTTDAAEADA